MRILLVFLLCEAASNDLQTGFTVTIYLAVFEDNEHGRADLFADPQQYTHGIQARRQPEGSPDPETLIIDDSLPHSMTQDTRCDINSLVGHTTESGIGIPQEGNTIVSFNVNVEWAPSYISPSSVLQAVAELVWLASHTPYSWVGYKHSKFTLHTPIIIIIRIYFRKKIILKFTFLGM